MDIHEIRRELRLKNIYEIPLRVTFYARVSTEKDAQLNSLDNQVTYYTDLIKKNPNWTYVDGYVDEGLSAMTTAKRENFHRMVDDAEAGLFDLIITKEISRFARNTLDSIQFTRRLLASGVGVFFQNDNINTLDEDSELRLTIMSGIAQDELRKLSSRIKFGHAEAIKKSVVLGNSRIFGYVKKDGRLVIDESEAPMVRELFELYATDEYSMKQIEDIFWERGYRNHNGNRISHSTMSNTIANPKYKGYYVGGKVQIVDMFTKKQKFLPPEEWVMFKDESGEIVPAIVSEELWEKANAVLARRSLDVKRRQNQCNHGNLLTGKLFCTHCGTAFYRRDSVDRQGNKNSKWVCSGKIKNGKDYCPTFPIYEKEIIPVLLDVFRDTSASAEALIAEYVEMYRSLNQGGDISAAIAVQQQRIDMAQKKRSKLLEYNVSGMITDAQFIAQSGECNDEIAAAEQRIAELTAENDSRGELREHIERLRSVLKHAERDAQNGLITRQFVEEYIDRIFVTIDDDGRAVLNIKVFTGEVSQRFLDRLQKRLSVAAGEGTILEGRTGHTFKKMIESYENSLK